MTQSSRAAAEKARSVLAGIRGDGVYKPDVGPGSNERFADSPLLNYRLYDKHFRSAEGETVYTHSLEELYIQAIDNADRLGTLEVLFQLRPNLAARTMTVRDLVLTSFVGTDDGEISHIFASPYRSQTAADLDTELFALAVSDFIPNNKDQPLRIAIGPHPATKKWAGLSGLKLFASSKTDALLEDLNKKVNKEQIVQLRNDPEGCTRYSAKYKEQMAKDAAERDGAGKEATGITKGNVVSGSEYDASGPSPSDPIAVFKSKIHQPQSSVVAAPLATGTTDADAAAETPAAAAETTAEPLAKTTSNTTGTAGKGLDISAISAPTRAANQEDVVTTVLDKMAIDASQSHPAFDELERTQSETASAPPAEAAPTLPIVKMA